MWLPKDELFTRARMFGVFKVFENGLWVAKEKTSGLVVKKLKTSSGITNWCVNNKIEILRELN
jgi:hypothetical protein